VVALPDTVIEDPALPHTPLITGSVSVVVLSTLVIVWYVHKYRLDEVIDYTVVVHPDVDLVTPEAAVVAR